MGFADIQKRQGEERKREKRLVHFTNAVTRDFLESKAIKSKAKAYRDNADYVTKSFLDYVFFNENKEIRELNAMHIEHFMLEFAPSKLIFSTEASKSVAEILAKFLAFMEEARYIHNGIEISTIAKKNNRAFLKQLPKTKSSGTKKIPKKTVPKKASATKKSKKAVSEIKVGRNDPCPCGSGKKYKNCCGRLK